MKKFLLGTLLFWLVAFTSQAQINNLAPVWANVFSSGNTATGSKVVVGANGNVYTIGHFTGTVDFDPSTTGVADLTAVGFQDIFVVATNATGNYLWVQQIFNGGSNSIAAGTGIVISPNGNDIYVCGFFQNSGYNGFVTRLNSAGAIVTQRTIGAGDALIHSICLDGNGYVIVVGGGAGIDFGEGIGNIPSNGDGDIFVLQMNANLTSRWARMYGGTDKEAAYGVITDATNNIYFTVGFRSNTVIFRQSSFNFPVFTPQIAVNNSAGNGETDIAVVSLDNQGNTRWATSAGAAGQDRGLGMVMDNGINALYCTGEITNASNPSDRNTFISRLNPANGAFVWTQQFGGTGTDIGKSITVGNNGDVYTAGTFTGSASFGANTLTGTPTRTSGFILRLNNSGGFVSANQITAVNNNATTNGIALDAANRIYVTGDFAGTARLNPSNPALNNVTSGATAAYTAVYVPFVCAVAISPASLPNNPLGTWYSLTVTQTGLTGAQTWSITAGALPTGLTLNASTGVISGTTNVAGTYTFTVRIGDATCSGARTYTIVIACPTITIFPVIVVTPPPPPPVPDGTRAGVSCPSASILAEGALGIPYTQVFTQTGLATGVWAVSAGTIPVGLTLNPTTGVLSGTPTQAGNFCFTVQVSNPFCSQTKQYSIRITCPEIIIDLLQEGISQGEFRITAPPVLTTPAMSGTVGVPYMQGFVQTGLTFATWSITAGNLPAGLSLNATTGTVSGTPTTGGTFCFTVQASGQNCSQTRAFCITIACPTITINPTILPNGSVCAPYTQQMSQTGLSGNVIWSITGGTLPSGLTIDPNTGLLNGTPTSVGTFTFVTTVTGSGCTGTRNHTLVVSCASATPAPLVLDFPEIKPEQCVGDSIVLNVKSGNGGQITYTSSDTSVATVTPNGVVYIIGVGNVCITAFQILNGNNGIFAQQCFKADNCVQSQPQTPTLKAPKNEVNLYPNPTEGVFEVEFTKSMGTLNVEVANAAGVVVLRETFTKKTVLENANETIKLDISALPAGLYLVKWNNGTTSGTKKVVKK